MISAVSNVSGVNNTNVQTLANNVMTNITSATVSNSMSTPAGISALSNMISAVSNVSGVNNTNVQTLTNNVITNIT
ncbi:hypothetical protein OMAG_001979, partial [Candidatus Omnitrophus magneticus]